MELIVFKKRNLGLCRKIFEHCHFVQNFPPVPEMISKMLSDPSPLGYGIFFLNMALLIRNLNIVILFRIHIGSRNGIRYLILLHWATAFYADFWVRQSVSPSVIGICKPLLNHSRVPDLFLYVNIMYVNITLQRAACDRSYGVHSHGSISQTSSGSKGKLAPVLKVN